ncbi:GHKL domain-containing protein [Sporosarcina sp. FSL K6-1522]|uniref:sensor histidine kinase n=1 Tax=Sporosarcina sp. FSL K6-1522 TaxID=2921554 RepID=UPI00315AF45D
MMRIFIAFSLLNFLIIYGSLFYILTMRVTVKRFILCLTMNTIVAILAFYFQEFMWISMISSIVLNGGLFYLFTKRKVVFIHLVMIHTISILAEYTAMLFVDFFHLSLYIHGSLIVLQIMIFIMLYKKTIEHYSVDIHLSAFTKWLFFIIVTVTFSAFYSLVFIPAEKGSFGISIFNLALLLFYFFIMISLAGILLRTIVKENHVKQKLIEQQQFTLYMQALEQVNREMQSFRHDYANILFSLRGYIENEDMKGLQTYFNEQIMKEEHCFFNKQQLFSQLDQLKIIELKGLLATKLLLADELAIPINIEIPDSIHSIAIDSIDLTRIMGVFLDNAIEASASLDKPQINLALFSRDSQVVIVIENRIKENEVIIHKLFEEHYSTKGDNRGIGLFTVRKILSSYPNVMFNSRVDNEWFIHEVIIEERVSDEGYHM